MQPQMTRQQYRAARHVMRSLNRATRLECGSAQRLAVVGLAAEFHALSAPGAADVLAHQPSEWIVGMAPAERRKQVMRGRALDRILHGRPAPVRLP